VKIYCLLLFVISAGCKSAIEKQTMESKLIVYMSCQVKSSLSKSKKYKVKFVINQVVTSRKGKVKSG